MTDNKLILQYVLDEGAFDPTHGHESDAGWDLKTPNGFTLNAHSSLAIDTGIHIDIPDGYVGFIKSKSGLNVKSSILSEGVIDAGYTGSIVVKLYNNSDVDKEFSAGDKITQIVFLPIPSVGLVKVSALNEHERGANGFGSTGK